MSESDWDGFCADQDAAAAERFGSPREDVYEGGEVPDVGDVVLCIEDDDDHPPHLESGKHYTVNEFDGGYIYFDAYGWWPTRFRLIRRA